MVIAGIHPGTSSPFTVKVLATVSTRSIWPLKGCATRPAGVFSLAGEGFEQPVHSMMKSNVAAARKMRRHVVPDTPGATIGPLSSRGGAMVKIDLGKVVAGGILAGVVLSGFDYVTDNYL